MTVLPDYQSIMRTYTFSNVPQGMRYKICDHILLVQALSMAVDKLRRYNHLQLHTQTPRQNLKVTEYCVELPPCCANLLWQAIAKAKPWSQSICLSDLQSNLTSSDKRALRNFLGVVG